MSLREMLSDYWYAFQQELFPRLESDLGPLGERYELFVAVLELVRVEALLPCFRGQVGRPEEDRAALARAFIAKAVFDVPTTRALIERLEVDGRLRRLCGWSGGGRLPSEATFSRGFFRVCREPSCEPSARDDDCADDGRPSGGAHLARRDGDRGGGRSLSRRQRSRRGGASGDGRARERSGRRSRAVWNGN